MKADLILTNANVYTVDARRSHAEAVAIADGCVVAVGAVADVEPLAGSATQVLDVGHRLVLPGFIDSHMHASAAAEELHIVALDRCDSVSACLTAVASFAQEHPDLPAIHGVRWANTIVPPGGLLATDLDTVVPDRPALLYDDSYHSAWANSAALREAGIAVETPDPASGIIERLPNGTPSGTLREGAIKAVAAVLPKATVEQAREGILLFQRSVAGPLGLTTVHDAGLRPGEAALDAYELLQARDELTVRYCLSFWIFEDEPLQAQIAQATSERERHRGALVRPGWAKLFPDGVIEGHTACLKQPYADRPGFCGDPVWRPEALIEASVAAATAGFRLHYHAIGDAAVALSLDAIAAAQAATGRHDERPLITHLELVDSADVGRFAELGAVAVPQPNWFLTDTTYRDLIVPLLGRQRADHQYPMKSFWDAGAVVASASDYPVPPAPDPIVGIQRGVLRRAPGDDEDLGALWPEQAVSVEQMVESFTINGAYSHFLEHETGSLEVGKSADLVVLSRDILACPPEEITAAEVELTLFRGRAVHAGGPFAGLADD